MGMFDDLMPGAPAGPGMFDDLPPPKPAGMLRKLADKGLGFASGAVGATKAIADATGAGNRVSGALGTANEFLNDNLSAEAKADQQQQSAILDAAKGQGAWEGVKAGARAFGVAPVQTAVQGLGSIVPIIAGTALTGGAAPAAAVGAGIGAAMGLGTAKGAIYDEIKKRGGTDAEATKAQEYGGANTDQIAISGALGTADALTGASRIAGGMVRNALGKPVVQSAVQGAERGILGRAGMGVLGEMPLEAAQGGQEQLAANIAAQRAGYQAGTWDNVASNATLEALASAGPGAVFGAMDRQQPTTQPQPVQPGTPPENQPPVNPITGQAPPSVSQVTPEEVPPVSQVTPDQEPATAAPVATPVQAEVQKILDATDGAPGPLASAAIAALNTGATPVAQPTISAFDQREADRPRSIEGDIAVGSLGQPLTNRLMAAKAARAKSEETGTPWQPIELGSKKYVIRPVAQDGATNPIQPLTDASTLLPSNQPGASVGATTSPVMAGGDQAAQQASQTSAFGATQPDSGTNQPELGTNMLGANISQVGDKPQGNRQAVDADQVQADVSQSQAPQMPQAEVGQSSAPQTQGLGNAGQKPEVLGQGKSSANDTPTAKEEQAPVATDGVAKLNDGIKDNGVGNPDWYSNGYPWETGIKVETAGGVSQDGSDILKGFKLYSGAGMKLRDAIRHAEIYGKPVPQSAYDELQALRKPNNTPTTTTIAPPGVTQQPAQPVTGQGAGVSQPTQDVQWDSMTPDAKTDVLKRAGWRTNAGGLNVVGKNLLKKKWADIVEGTQATITKNIKPQQQGSTNGTQAKETITQKQGQPEAQGKYEPWKMTREQYFNDANRVRSDVLKGKGDGYVVKYTYTNPSGAGPFKGATTTSQKYVKGDSINATFGSATVVSVSTAKPESIPTGELFDEAKAFHRASVEKAIAQGKDVPVEVLADYPDLKPSQPSRQEKLDALPYLPIKDLKIGDEFQADQTSRRAKTGGTITSIGPINVIYSAEYMGKPMEGLKIGKREITLVSRDGVLFSTKDTTSNGEQRNKVEPAQSSQSAAPDLASIAKETMRGEAVKQISKEESDRLTAENMAATEKREQAAESPEVKRFYVTMIRGNQVARLAGPFDTKEQAEAMVQSAREEANKADPRSVFDAFGVTGVAEGTPKPGVLNKQLGIDAAGKPAAITQDDVESATKQALRQIEQTIDNMKADAVQRIAVRFLPTMGIKTPIGKARIKTALADQKVNMMAAASEFGVALPKSIVDVLEAQIEGKIQPLRETITPADDTNIGVNVDGNQLYQRKDGSVYQMRDGRPSFSGFLEPISKAEPTEITHNGTRIYKTKVKLDGEIVDKWSVQSQDNKRKAAAGERTIGGDSLHDTLDAAKKAADFEAKQEAQAQARKAESDAQEKEAQAKKDANKGKSIVERRKESVLDSATKLPPQAGLGAGTKRESMQKAVDQERAIVEKMVDDTAAKKRDNEAIDLVRARGFILGLSNENIPVVKAGLEAQARLKANDYKKPSYRVHSGRDTDSSFYEISKTEYDYAQELKAQPKDPRENYIKSAADSIGRLRKSDVDRVLNGLAKDNIDGVTRADLAAYIKEKHPDYTQEVDDVLAEIATATKSPADLVAGDRFKDANGAEFQVWSARQGRIEAHPVVDGKPVVNRDSVQRWATTDAVHGANPEYRTDIVVQHAAVHQDPGKAPEAATAPVIAQSLAKAGKNEQQSQKEMRLWLVGEIDKAVKLTEDYADYQDSVNKNGQDIADSIFFGKHSRNIGLNTQAGNGMITFDVPGDGKFKIRNSLRGLMEFRAKVEAKSGTGFTDKPTKAKGLPASTGVAKGSASQIEALSSMLEELDFEAAVDYARETGTSLDSVKISPEVRKQFETYLKDGTEPQQFSPSRYWEYPGIDGADKDGNPIRRATLTKQIGADEYQANVTGTNATGFKYNITKSGKSVHAMLTSNSFANALKLAEDAINAIQPEVVKPKDTGWNMAGVGFAGKRYRGRNITLDDGREVVARIYENAGQYEDAEVKVDGVSKFRKTDRYKAEKLADDFIRTLTAKEPVKAPIKVTPQVSGNAEKFIKIAADSVEKLRQVDVERVLSETPVQFRAEVVAYIKSNRAGLSDEVDAVMADLNEPAQAKPEEPKREFRNPDSLNVLHAPIEDKDWFKLKNGEEWQARQGYSGRGWSLVRDGSLHPEARNFESQSDFIRSVIEVTGQTQAAGQVVAPVESNDEPIPAVSEAQARKQFEWRNMGQKDGTKSHLLFFFESEKDKGTGAAMNRGEVSLYPGASGWKVEDGDGTSYKSLADAKKAAIDRAIPILQDQGYILKPAQAATAILDAANVTGKERIDALKDVKKGDITPEELQAAYPAKEDGEKTEPWKMTRAEAAESFPGDEYDKMLNRHAVLGDITYEESNKRSRINITGNKEFWAKTRKELLQDKKDAVKFARGDRAEVNKMKPTEGFAAWRIKSMSATGKAAIEAAGEYHDGLLAVHKERVQEALDEGRDVPAEVLADYPDLKAGQPTQETQPAAESKPAAQEPVKPVDDDFLADPKTLDAEKIKAGYAHRSASVHSKVEMERNWYVDAIKKAYDYLLPLARNPQQLAKLKDLLREFRDEYREKRYRVFDAGSSAFSVVAAGRSNFNQGASDRSFRPLESREKAFNEWLVKHPEDMKVQLLQLRTTEEKAEDDAKAEKIRINKLTAPIIGDLAQIIAIDLNQSPMNRASFVSAVVRKVANLHRDNEADALKNIFSQISKWDAEHKKPLFSDRSPIWQYKPKPETDTGTAMYSRATTTKPTTVSALQKAVRQLTGRLTPTSKLGHIVATTAAEIKSTWEPLIDKRINIDQTGNEGKAQAFFDPKTKTIFLIADNIEAGTETAVSAHELMHKHGKPVLGEIGWSDLHSVIESWSNAAEGTNERKVYDFAAERVNAIGAELSSEELFPYAVEAAFRIGIKPNAIARTGTVAKWLAKVKQALREVWDKVVGNPKTFDAQDLVNLAYGIAQREMHDVGVINNPMTNRNVVGKQGGRSADDTAPGVLFTDENDNAIVYEREGFRISVNRPGAASYVVLWAKQEVNGKTYWRKAGTLDTNQKTKKVGGVVGEYLGVSSIEIEKAYRAQGLGLEMYRALMANAAPNIAGVISHTPNRVNKQQVPRIYRKLGAFTDGDNQIIPIGRNEPTAPDSGGAIRNSRKVDQTDTPAFKAWFGDSKVVDANGKPLVVYHGTSAKVVAFDFDYAVEGGFFLSVDKEQASRFGKNVMPLYVSMQNPFVVQGGDIPVEHELEDIESIVSMAKDGGHDGVFIEGFRDMKNVPVDTYIAFNPTQIKSAIGNRGTFDPANPDIRYSRASNALNSVRDGLSAATVTDLKHKFANRLSDFRPLALQGLGRRQLVEIYEKLLPQLKAYDKRVSQMDADKNESSAEADTLVTSWGKLKDEKQLAELMHDSTLAQIDPTKGFVQGDDVNFYEALKEGFRVLSPEAKATYIKARDMYKEHHAKVREAIRERIERSILSSEKKQRLLEKMDGEFFKKVKGVYFPLSRFGQYLTIVRDENGEVLNVSRSETMNEAEETRRILLREYPAAGGFQVGKVLKQREFNAVRDGVGRGFMADLFDTLESSGVGEDVQDAISQLYLASLPDLSWAKHGIHRKGTPGFSQDARRAFAQNMFHGGNYLAKLRHADQLQTGLTDMQEHIDNRQEEEGYESVKAQQVLDEMVKRHDSLMNPQSNPISTALTSFGFVFHLGLSPASAVVNLTQTALVAYPLMGAKWGFDKAWAALLTASKQAATNRNDISKILTGAELDAYKKAVSSGVIDVTQSHDLAGVSQGEDSKLSAKIRPVMKWASFMFHHAERFNRQVTFVAAYRLAKQAGQSEDAAFESAVKMTYGGHFDYSASNRARIMQGNVAKVVLLFKQYAQNMIYTLGRNLQQAIQAETPEARKEAGKALGGLLVAHALAAGAFGLPVVGTLLALASAIGGDDDEPWDAKVALQNMLADTFGSKSAEVMVHGLSRLTPWDISGRVGLDKLLFPDIQEGLQQADAVKEWMTAALGPVAGVAVNAGKGMQEMADGRYLKGLESMMPVALRNPLKSIRYGTEGNIDKSGIAINDEVGFSGVVGQFLGFSPSETRLAQEGKSAVLSADRKIQDRRSHLMRQYAMAVLEGDEQTKAETKDAIAAFNGKNPHSRINPLQLAQSVRARRLRIDQAKDGIYLPKKRQDAREAGRFALEDS